MHGFKKEEEEEEECELVYERIVV
jgi:hypothetical protein